MILKPEGKGLEYYYPPTIVVVPQPQFENLGGYRLGLFLRVPRCHGSKYQDALAYGGDNFFVYSDRCRKHPLEYRFEIGKNHSTWEEQAITTHPSFFFFFPLYSNHWTAAVGG